MRSKTGISLRLLISLLMLSWLLPVSSGSNPAHIDTARHYLYVRETQGNNRSPDIDRWNKAVHAPPGSSYCAAYGSYCMTAAKVIDPSRRTALAKGFVDKKLIKANDILRKRAKVTKGDIIIFTHGNTIHGHFAFAEADWDYDQGKTIEANTSSGEKGSQSNGDGVYERWRKIQPNASFRILGIRKVK